MSINVYADKGSIFLSDEIDSVLEVSKDELDDFLTRVQAAAIKAKCWVPECLRCGAPTVRRTNGTTGEAFLGCSKYPECKGSLNADGSSPPPRRSRRPGPFDFPNSPADDDEDAWEDPDYDIGFDASF
jgi:ssDNA-binding Zn-finger/Zn-ribbon topoisomerase 1